MLADQFKPHAVMLPRPFLKDDLSSGRTKTHEFIKEQFAPILRVKKVYTFAQTNQYFVARHHNDSLQFPAMTPLYPEERYQWIIVGKNANGPFTLGKRMRSYLEQPDTIRFGFLRDPMTVRSPTPSERSEYNREHMAYVIEMREKARRLVELMEIERRRPLSASQASELQQLKAEMT